MRVFNFSAGPATLPESVLRQAADEMLDWRGSGMSVMEMSHRGKEYMEIHATALADLRELLAVPDNYRILFLQGGGLGENAIVPMNLLGGPATGREANFVVTGSWSTKSLKEAERYGSTHIAASGKGEGFIGVPTPASWALSANPAYVHVCSNETINGIEFSSSHIDQAFARLTPAVPLVADISSHMLSRAMDVAKYGVLFGGAQKNVGIAGLTVVIVRDDLLDRALSICPSAFEWKTVDANDSMFNTPPTYAIYIAGLVFKWLKAQGGLQGIEARNIEKAQLLYDTIDSSALYRNVIQHDARSRMNVPFTLADESLNAAFLEEAKSHGLIQLKGHKSVGGMRASIYNAMPIEGVRALVDYMRDFEKRA